MNGSDNLEDQQGGIETEVVDTHGLFSGNQQEANHQRNDSGNPVYPGSGNYPMADNGYGGQSYYGNQPGAGYGMQSPYGNQPGTGYGGQSYYGNQPGTGYGGQSYYGNQPGMGYGVQSAYDSQSSYGNPANGGYGGQPPYGNQPPYDNPYSPFAMPQKKQHTGLIIGIVVVIIILFLIAVVALASRAADLLSEKEKKDLRRDVYNFDDAFDFDDDYDHDHNDYFYHDDDYGYDYDYDYDDYFDDAYDEIDYDNEKYYTIHNDIKDDLSYQVEMEYYEYEMDNENLMLIADYPVISGEEVPNLDKLNKAVRKEVDRVTELFEKDYKKHMQEDEDAYFVATLGGCVTYMDEDKLSVVYQETIYNDMDDMGSGVYLISVNVDMKNGVVLDNKEILKIDDAFSIDFRERSDEQNGEISSLNYMTDQEITNYFNSDDVIVFYTPKGMEIGFNYEDGYGWVTVTYEEYEEYLKVF